MVGQQAAKGSYFALRLEGLCLEVEDICFSRRRSS